MRIFVSDVTNSTCKIVRRAVLSPTICDLNGLHYEDYDGCDHRQNIIKSNDQQDNDQDFMKTLVVISMIMVALTVTWNLQNLPIGNFCPRLPAFGSFLCSRERDYNDGELR